MDGARRAPGSSSGARAAPRVSVAAVGRVRATTRGVRRGTAMTALRAVQDGLRLGTARVADGPHAPPRARAGPLFSASPEELAVGSAKGALLTGVTRAVARGAARAAAARRANESRHALARIGGRRDSTTNGRLGGTIATTSAVRPAGGTMSGPQAVTPRAGTAGDAAAG